MKNLCCALLLLLPLTALAVSYPIEVDESLNGAEVSVSPESIDRDLAGLLVYNYGARPVECSAVFKNGPEVPRTRQAVIASGERLPMTVKFRRDIIKLRVKLTCNPQ
ncbi:3-phosphoglycerate kinase [Stutzerimonas urumqiensis]|uniref:3-phosphoglycerate kinase n=1 Tax=Stutzerimonas urumqiensis TaxID=638269 RepID=UPI003BA94E59